MKQTIRDAAWEYEDHCHCYEPSTHFTAGVEWMREQYEKAVYNYIREHDYMSDSDLDRMLEDIDKMIQ